MDDGEMFSLFSEFFCISIGTCIIDCKRVEVLYKYIFCLVGITL